MDNNNSSVPRIHVSPPPPSPPMFSFIAALVISMLIFMCVYVFSIIISVAILLTLYITSMLYFRFIHNGPELDIGLRERTTFYAQTPQRVVRISDKLFWVVEERGNQRSQRSVKKLLGSVVCFGSQAMTSGKSDCCAICLEDFKKGDECFVFPVCGHAFHFHCINHWLEKKPNCPICRHCIPSTATMITKTGNMEFMANLV